MRLTLYQDQDFCSACPLYRSKRVRKQYIPTDVVYDRVGPDEKTPEVDVMVIGDMPSRTEDVLGMPFAGSSGKEIFSALKRAGSDGSYALANLVRCRPVADDGSNRPPTTEEISACSNYIKQDIEALNPKVVVMMGNTTLRVLNENPEWEKVNVGSLRGHAYITKSGRTHLVTLPPSTYLRSESATQRRRFYRHMRSAGRFASGKTTSFSAKGEIETILDLDRFNELMDWYEQDCDTYVSLDYETENLNHVARNRVATIQFSASNDKAHVIPLQHWESPWSKEELRHVRKRLRRLLGSRKTKIPFWLMHNAQFDGGITFNFLKLKKIAKPVVDTMFLAYLQDENQCGDDDGGKKSAVFTSFALKTLARELLGFYTYDTELSDAIAARSGASGGSLWNLSLDRLSEYGGTDAYITRRIFDFYRLWLERQGYSSAVPFAKKFYSRIFHLLTKMSINGFATDVDQLSYLKSEDSPIISRYNEIPGLIKASEEAKKANEILLEKDSKTAGMTPLFGKKPWVFSLRKKEHKLRLFVDACGLEPISFSKKTDEPQIDKAYLDHYKKHPVVSLYKEYTGLDKLISSYLDSVSDILVSKPDNKQDGKIHARFHATRTVTGRLACLPAGTRIATDSGLVPIEKVVPGDLIQTDRGIQEVKSAWEAGTKEILEFTLSNGKKLRCSPLHRVFSDGKWTEAQNLKEGDDLYISGREGPDVSNHSTLSPPSTIVGRSNTPTFPSTMDSRVAFLLGHFVAEGCIGYNNLRPTKKEPNRKGKVPSKVIIALGWDEKPLRDFLTSEWKEVFGVDFSYQENGSPTLECSSVDLSRWLVENGFGYKSRDAVVPDSVFSSGLSERRSFLRGLFEGDAGSSSGDPRLSTESGKLAEGVGLLLASLGIHHSISSSKRPDRNSTKYSVLVSNDQDLSWLFWSSLKRDQIRKHSIHLGVFKPSWFDFDSFWKPVKIHHNLIGRKGCSSPDYHRLHKARNRKTARITRKVQSLVTSAVGPEHGESAEFVHWALESNSKSFEIIRVKSLGAQKVYDLEVPATRSFLVDGIVVHNSSDPNLQQLPKGKGNNAKAAIRSIYGASPGHILVECDFGQAEVRWWAQLAGDTQYARLFHEMKNLRDEYKLTGDEELGNRVKAEADIHKKVASIMFQKSVYDVTGDERKRAKSLCFGSIYGQHFKTLASLLGITPDEALKLQGTFVNEFERAGQWLSDIEREAESMGFVSTPMGRVRHLRDLFEQDENGAKRRARNSPIQAVSSDTTALCAWAIQDWIERNDRPYKIINCVHDAITMEVPMDFDMVQEVVSVLQEKMVDQVPSFLKEEFGIDMIVPMEIDYDFGVRWGHMLGWDGVGSGLRPIFDRCKEWDSMLQSGTPWHVIAETSPEFQVED